MFENIKNLLVLTAELPSSLATIADNLLLVVLVSSVQPVHFISSSFLSLSSSLLSLIFRCISSLSTPRSLRPLPPWPCHLALMLPISLSLSLSLSISISISISVLYKCIHTPMYLSRMHVYIFIYLCTYVDTDWETYPANR